MSSAKCREVRGAETDESRTKSEQRKHAAPHDAGVFLRTQNSKMVALESGPGRGRMGLATLISSVQAT